MCNRDEWQGGVGNAKENSASFAHFSCCELFLIFPTDVLKLYFFLLAEAGVRLAEMMKSLKINKYIEIFNY